MTGEDSTVTLNDMGAVGGEIEGGARADSDSLKHRLFTYDHRWAGQKNKEELAGAGFSYTVNDGDRYKETLNITGGPQGIGDKVECDQCGLKLLNWTATDDPLHEHTTRRPLCPFINSRYRQLGQTKPPKHPQYQELQERLDSFVAWPGRYVPKTPEELAAAGFFYIGSADRVTCFQCGITLRDWEEEHDPVEEHRRYSENCQFINKTDINQLGVSTRTPTNTNGHHSEHDETGEMGGACGGEQTAISEHSFEKANMMTCQTTDDEILQAPSSPGACISSAATSPAVSTNLTNIENIQPCSELENNNNSETEVTHTTVPAMTSCSTNNLKNHQIPVPKRLADENKRLKERRTCRVCQKEAVSILFLPCGHLVTCSDCAPKVTDCITCGKTILGTVRTYFT